MAKKTKVFVSYSRHDGQVERVSAFTKWLEQIAKDRYQSELEFVTDTRMRSSDDVNSFEQSLRLYSAVLVIGTEEYLYKARNGDFGVTREFPIIVKCLKDRKINVYTTIMEATHKEVIPKELHGPLARTFVGLVHDHHVIEISDQIRTIHYAEATALVNDILTNDSEIEFAIEDFDVVETEIRRKLFFEQKQEVLNTTVPAEILQRIFVKTSAFFAAKKHNAFLFVGRKGSGKSFLTEYFASSFHSANQVNIGLHFRDYDLSYVFGLKSDSALKADFGTHFPQSDLMEAAWTLSYIVAAMFGLLVETMNGRIEYDLHALDQIAALAEKTECLHKDGATNRIDYLRLIDWCISKAFHTVEVAIKNLPTGMDYHATINSTIHFAEAGKLVPEIIGQPAIQEFVKATNKLQPNFLVTVDGFDTKFDRFREKTRNLAHTPVLDEHRIQFEIDWMRGLLETSLRINDHSIQERLTFLKNCHFRQLIR